MNKNFSKKSDKNLDKNDASYPKEIIFTVNGEKYKDQIKPRKNRKFFYFS